MITGFVDARAELKRSFQETIFAWAGQNLVDALSAKSYENRALMDIAAVD